MIKDIVVNLPVDTKHDVTTDFAASMAGAFNAHLAAIAFVHRPIVPGSLPYNDLGVVVLLRFLYQPALPLVGGS